MRLTRITALVGAVLLTSSFAGGAAADGNACSFKPVDPPNVPPIAGIILSAWSLGCPGSPATTAILAEIDTTQGLTFDATPAGTAPSYAQETTSAYIKRTGVHFAVNANLFDACCGYTAPDHWVGLSGLAVAGGQPLSQVGADPSNKGFPFNTSLVIGNGTLQIVTLEKGDQPPAGTQIAVTGSHRILTGSKIVAPPSNDTEFFGPNARTAAGLSSDGGRLYLVVVNGHWFTAGNPANYGATLAQEAAFLQERGASDAINLDGGGSTTMAVQDASGANGIKVLNVPSDGVQGCTFKVGETCERYVGLNFGVRAQASTSGSGRR